MKKESGITLVALVITVVIIIILSSIGINSGVSTIRSAKYTAFASELKIMQTEVNELYQEKKYDLGEELTDTDTRKEVLETEELAQYISDDIKSGFRYFSKEYIAETLKLEGISRDYLINVQSRKVVSAEPLKYEGKMYYMIEQIEGGYYNVDYNNQNPTSGKFNVNVSKDGSKYKVEVTNIDYQGYVNNWQVKYKLVDNEYWSTSNDFTFYLDISGVYDIKVVHDEVELDSTQFIIPWELADKVSVGDYVDYNATNDYSYTSLVGTGASHGNGDSEQTFSSSSDIKWRVLSKDSKTGEVVLISEEPIGNFTMNGAIGYLYAEEELNRICSIYGHGIGADTSKEFACNTGDTIEGLDEVTLSGSGARSINVDDINKICNVTPSEDLDSNYGKAPYTKSIYYPTTSTSTGYAGPAERTDVYTSYLYTGSTYLTSTEEPYKILFRDTANANNITYWLASRCVYSDSSYSSFFVREVLDGRVRINRLCYGKSSDFYEAPQSHGIRPIVYLKTTLRTSGKNDDGEWKIIDSENGKLANNVSVGDYVDYNATNDYSYTSLVGTGASHGNGNSEQTFSSSSDIKWRVLSKDTYSGEVVLISEAPIGSFTMNGAIGYLYAEEELNRICSIYGHGIGANINKEFICKTGDTIEGLDTVTLSGSGARSINVDDINKICNVTPSKDLSSDYGKTPYTKNIYYPTKTTDNGISGPASRTDVYTYYKYIGSTYLTSTEEPYKMLFRDISDSSNISYWLASRMVYSDPSYSYFYARIVYDGYVDFYSLGVCDISSFSEIFRSRGIRPIVYLKTTLQTNGKDSNGVWKIVN